MLILLCFLAEVRPNGLKAPDKKSSGKYSYNCFMQTLKLTVSCDYLLGFS